MHGRGRMMGNKKPISSGFIQSILNRRLVSVHIVAAIIATVAICILTNGEPVNEVIRNIIFATGGVGALYGLIIASRRQDDFKKQTQLQHDQRFSEKLSTCLETIAKEDPLSQTAGFLLLKELYEAAVDNQLNLIDDIMKQYIISKTDIIFRKIEDSQWTKQKDPNDRLKSLLIAQAFKYFIEKPKITGEPDDLSDLNFIGLFLQDFTFRRPISFNSSHFNRTVWSNTNFEGKISVADCKFDESLIDHSNWGNAQFTGGGFSKANISNTEFNNCSFKDTEFSNTKFKHIKFNNSVFINNNYTDAVFEDCDISGSQFIFESDLSDEDMKNKHTLEKINRLQEQLDTLIFEKGRTPEFLIIINDNQIKDHPVLKVNPARAYEWVNDKGNKYRRLVQSGIIIDKQDHNKKDNKEHDDQVSEKDSETFLDWMASIWPWK